MRIAIDALGIDIAGGGRTSILNLMLEIFKQDVNNDYLILLTKYEPSFEPYRKKVKQLVIANHNRFLVRILAQVALLYRRNDFDLIHYTKNLGFFGLKKPSIVTIHDLTTLLYPNLVPKIDFIYWRTIQRVTIKNAKIVITVSNTTANDVSRIYRVPLNKIHVISHGISHNFSPVPNDEIKMIRKKYDIPEKYYLHVGRIDKKKNLTLLVEAFANLLKKHNFNGKLVLVGQEYKKSPDEKLHQLIQQLGLDERVLFTGFIPDEDLPAIYSGAISCVFPSIHEGFGLFAIEAMACGTPIIASKGGALEETVQDAGLVLDPCTIENLTHSMYEMYENRILRDKLVKLGLERAENFNWRMAAMKMISIYENIGDLG